MPLVSASDVSSKTFDYIIVGSHLQTAGLTLANRLSEDPNICILVLEAGPANINDPAICTLRNCLHFVLSPDFDPSASSVPQKHANGVEYAWPRGKTLGGSSAINFMVWTRPPKQELDDLEKLGNPGWNWETLDKSLKKIEGYVKPSAEAVKKYDLKVENWTNGADGTLSHSFQGNIIHADVVWRDVGYFLPTGVFFTTNTIDPVKHTRSYSTTAFYLPAKDRKNFLVVVDSLVSRLITKMSANGMVVAQEVEFINGGETHTVKIGKEVVLSAGALKSPQILELSGIGRKEVLDKAGIPIVIDLPGVGENLQEHIFTGVSFELKNDVDFDTVDLLRDPEHLKKHLDLHEEGKGLFTTGILGFSFAPLQRYSPRADAIHREAIEKFENNKDQYPPGLRDQLKIQTDRLKSGGPGCELVTIPGFLSFPNPPKSSTKYWTVLSAQNHLFSRGNVHITTKNPKVDPAYDPHYFEEKIDLDTFVETIRFIRHLKEVAPFKDIVVAEVNPGPNCTTDEQIADWLKNYMATTYHTAATCSMLPKDKGGVVDPELKVYGTSNVRICDLSILPLHFASHPQVTIYSFAQRAAEIIRGTAA
ncbi:alcohol oxidase [Vararia minispora EC-137]|uniref:Alcohol oxidase n=1 Tax=Vararia minispora EC-137 TaxID=1314806 RepID=A0ACB8QGX6_9AGAM|nr:alcohol oxidase [Vararia minispora EC-137]